jgi:arsenate reductase
MAEALLVAHRDARVAAGSAGTRPAERVHPYAVAELERRGIDWSQARPKHVDQVLGDGWDIVITVCDSARETCPVLPGNPVTAHWGVADPAPVRGDEAQQRRAFWDAAQLLGRRIELLLSLPIEKLEALALQRTLREIGTRGASRPATSVTD